MGKIINNYLFDTNISFKIVVMIFTVCLRQPHPIVRNVRIDTLLRCCDSCVLVVECLLISLLFGFLKKIKIQTFN